MAKMPRQKPGRSRQCYATPLGFIRAVEAYFGQLDFDLAATPKNAKADQYFTRRQNALTRVWEPKHYHFWLNPPYSHLAPWAKKCSETKLHYSGWILLLVPASVSSNWFRDHVVGKATVYFLSPRLCFLRDEPYPKDLALIEYKRNKPKPDQMFYWWDWKQQTVTNQKGVTHEYSIAA